MNSAGRRAGARKQLFIVFFVVEEIAFISEVRAQHWTKSLQVPVLLHSTLWSSFGGEADTREAEARQPPDLLENKTAANDTQVEVLTWLITNKLSGGAGRALREAVARPVLTHRFAHEVCRIQLLILKLW